MFTKMLFGYSADILLKYLYAVDVVMGRIKSVGVIEFDIADV